MPKKPVSYELIDSTVNASIFDMLNKLISNHHRRLTNAAIALAWHRGLKPDADGRLVLGKTKKCSDLDRELASFDFVIVLNRDFWLDTLTKNFQREALLDHELCHCEVTLDEDGEPKRDERDRVVYRTRKHDIEEFSDVVRRHGVWRHDLERFAFSLATGPRQGSLLDSAELRANAADLLPENSSISSITFGPGTPEAVTFTREDAQALRESNRKGKRQPPAAGAVA